MRTNYFPPAEVLLDALKLTNDELRGPQKILVSRDLIRYLIQLALRNVPFDDDRYLKANPDVAGAWSKQQIVSLAEHFASQGYFEGRNFTSLTFDERWYIETNKDVAAGLRAGKVKSAREHYETIGKREGRAPSADAVAEVELWRKLLSPQPPK